MNIGIEDDHKHFIGLLMLCIFIDIIINPILNEINDNHQHTTKSTSQTCFLGCSTIHPCRWWWNCTYTQTVVELPFLLAGISLFPSVVCHSQGIMEIAQSEQSIWLLNGTKYCSNQSKATQLAHFYSKIR